MLSPCWVFPPAELSSAFWVLKMFFRAKELNYVVVFSALQTDIVQVE